MAQTLKDLLKTKILVGQVYSIDEVNGTIEVKYITESGFKKFTIPSVFVGNDSWIRAYPQIGSYVLIADTEDSQFPEIIKVFDPSEKARFVLDEGLKIDENPETPRSVTPFDRVASATNDAKDELGKIGYPYRRLKAGELEASSSGKASWWLGSKGELILKGGLSKLEMDPFKNTLETFSAGHLKLGLDSTLDSYGDQEYFGVVRRPTSNRVSLFSKINTIDSRIAKLTRVEVSYERIDKAILDLDSIATENKNNLNVQHQVGTQLIKDSNSLASINNYFLRLSDVHTQTYIQSLQSLSDYSKSYVPDSSNITKLNEGIDELKTWKASIDDFINKSNRPQDPGNDEETLLKAVKSGEYFKEIPEIDIKSLSSSLSNEIIALPLSTLQDRKAALNIEKASVETQQQEEEQAKTKKIDSKYLYQTLVLNSEANSDSVFAKEYRVNVSWKGSNDTKPRTLYEKIAGNVYKSDGTPDLYSNAYLRSRETFGTEKESSEPSDNTNIYVDTYGNMYTQLASGASRGYTLGVPAGPTKITCGGNLEITANSNDSTTAGAASTINIVEGDFSINVGSSSIKFTRSGEITITGTSVIINGQKYENNAVLSKINSTVNLITGSLFSSAPIQADPSRDDKAKVPAQNNQQTEGVLTGGSFVGDSIAKGLGSAQTSDKSVFATEGYNTKKILDSYKDKGGSKYTVISMGTNDWGNKDPNQWKNTEENMKNLRDSIKSPKVIWIVPNTKLNEKNQTRLAGLITAAQLVIKIAGGDPIIKLSDYICTDGIHPDGSEHKKIISEINKLAGIT